MPTFLRLSVLLAMFAAAPAMAQGTASQRAACEDDAKRLCEAQIPDVVAIENCLKANAANMSAACREEMGLVSTAAQGGKKRKH